MTKFLKFSFLVTLLVILGGCSKDAPTPTDEREGKGHEDPAKVEFVIRRGHLHGDGFHGNPISDIFPIQKFIFELDPATKNWVRKNGDGKILKSSQKDSSTGEIIELGEEPILMVAGWSYAMEIVYYNIKGERMNAEFTTAEMLPIHQHFFTLGQYKNYKTNKSEKAQSSPESVGALTRDVLDYVYRDTNPEYLQKDFPINPNDPTKGRSVLTGDPLGLKGYFKPKKAYAQFDLEVQLRHVTRGDKYINGDKTKTLSFSEPSWDIIGRSTTDFLASLPVCIITETNSDASDFDRYIQDLADYFGKTTEEIKADLYKSGGHDDSVTYWM